MKTIQMLLCDDDFYMREYYTKLLHKHITKDLGNMVDLHVYESSSQLLLDRERIEQADLILIDICMEGIDGIRCSEIIRETNEHIEIVFISSSPDYVFDCFKVQPANYFLKNKTSDGEMVTFLLKLIDKCRKNDKEGGFICIRNERKSLIRIEDIIAFEVLARQVMVHTLHGDYSTPIQIQELYERLCNQGFEKVNRSCLVNMKHIQRIEGGEVFMNRKYIFQITIRKVSQFKDQFRDYLMQEVALN